MDGPVVGLAWTSGLRLVGFQVLRLEEEADCEHRRGHRLLKISVKLCEGSSDVIALSCVSLSFSSTGLTTILTVINRMDRWMRVDLGRRAEYSLVLPLCFPVFCLCIYGAIRS